jgi:hypothetical protein
MTQIIIIGKNPAKEQEALEAIEGIQVEIVPPENEGEDHTKPNFLSLAGK